MNNEKREQQMMAAADRYADEVCGESCTGAQEAETINDFCAGWRAADNSRWIPVEEELPKKLEGVGVSTYVLVKYGLSEDKEYNVMRYNYCVNRWFDKSYNSHKNVTHWMPIVPPRKEE